MSRLARIVARAAEAFCRWPLTRRLCRYVHQVLLARANRFSL